MKNRIVLWGTNEQDERVLIAMELKPHDNKVEIMTFPETIATEEFSQRMMEEWRDGKPFELPEGHTFLESELTVADSILPDHLKVERSDLINRAQSEWHFTVLSVKLHETYKSELNELKEQIESLSDFDSNVWSNLKSFWDKVQSQVRDRNLFREQADSLRDTANDLFTKLKEMRARLDHDFKSKSKENFEQILKTVEDVEARAAKGMRLQPLFDELKQMQQKFRELEFTRDDRNKLWNRIDEAFKKIKNKRGGSDDNPGDRLRHRYDGLMAAIHRMQESIKRDRKDLEYENKKIASTDGQLEAQIRQAKIKMIEERLHSKEEKLKEMTETQVDLDRRLEAQAARDAKREKIEEAKRLAEQKIRGEMAAAAEAREEDVEKLEKAAEAIKERKGKKGDSLLSAAGTVLGDVLQDAITTARAVAEVAGEHIKEKTEDLKEEAREKVEELKDRAEELSEKIKDKAGELKEEAAEKVEELKDKAEKLGKKVKAKAEELKEEAHENIEEAKEKVAQLEENLAEKAEEWKEEAGHTLEEVVEKAEELGEKLKEDLEQAEEIVEEKIEELLETPAAEPLSANEDPAGMEEDTTEEDNGDVAPTIPEEATTNEEEPEEEK